MKTKSSAKAETKTAKPKEAKAAKNNDTEASPRSMPKGGKDPEGGLTAKGRKYFAEKEGAHLKPGVQGPADTPEKMVRKGSFLRRHFANPRGPMKDDKGEPTRLALSAHAWGEAVPQNMGDAKKLAAEGHQLLKEYHARKDEAPTAAAASAKAAGTRAATKKKSATKTSLKKTAAKKSTVKKTAMKKTVSRSKSAKETTSRT